MQFIDRVKIYIRSGNGGNGASSFRREKYVEFGGPDGGSGGKGSDIIIRTNSHLNTLIDYRYKQHFKGQTGRPGEGGNRTGKDASPLILDVPIGTQIIADDPEQTLLYDITEPTEFTLLKGGKGGLGNHSFKSSVNRAPTYAGKGESGEEMWIWLVLKLMANVGLVGFPNAGKSTFLSIASQAKPKIADYPFTTLKPMLGTVEYGYTPYIIADIPGLIEGASEGKGLGHRFLGHVERCDIILHLIDATEEDILARYQTIRKELASFNPKLAEKKEVIVLTKSDLCQEEDLQHKIDLITKATSQKIFVASYIHGRQGIMPILDSLAELLFSKDTQP